jgi:gamma-glutamyltranspeptidase/glutathione hydrolase
VTRAAWAFAVALALVVAPARLAGVREPVRTRHAMVIAPQPADEIGVRVLRSGGNAVDAAIAVGFALNAAYPYAGALGGGGFMLVRLADGRTSFIDFREQAPSAATASMYVDAQGNTTRESIEGWRSAGVPGTVRGFALAHRRFARLSWAADVAPAIELASKGFTASYAWLKGGAFYQPGDRLVLPDLARTLTRIAAQGPDEFYTGRTATVLADAMKAHGGLVTKADLAAYAPVERTPLVGRYRNYTIIGAPPPSSGGVGLLQMLGMLDGSGYEKAGFGAAASMHYLAEVMRRFYADRNAYLGDPAFVNNPITELIDPGYVAARRASIDPMKATPSTSLRPGLAPAPESAETTHYSVVDAEGNAVAVTYTLNGGFGNGITVPGLGFLLNNEMDDFTTRPGAPNLFGLVQGAANVIAPGKRPLSSMAPTIVLRDGELHMLLGGPGGSRIPTAVLQVLLGVVDFGMNPQEAVDAPRFHHQWLPDVISVERGFSPDALALLRARGHEVRVDPGPVSAVVELIVKDGGWLQGAADARRSGRASGY